MFGESPHLPPPPRAHPLKGSVLGPLSEQPLFHWGVKTNPPNKPTPPEVHNSPLDPNAHDMSLCKPPGGIRTPLKSSILQTLGSCGADQTGGAQRGTPKEPLVGPPPPKKPSALPCQSAPCDRGCGRGCVHGALGGGTDQDRMCCAVPEWYGAAEVAMGGTMDCLGSGGVRG